MAAPVPAEESVNLHNRLLDLSFEEDLAEIEQIQWRLKTVVSRQPDDVDARVTLIEAYRSGGSRAGAVDLANQVFQHHASLELRLLETYLAELVGLGLYDRAKPLFMQLASDRTPGRNSSLLANASCAAVASGDVSWLEEIASVDDDTCPAVQYLDVIKRSGLAEHFLVRRRRFRQLRSHRAGRSSMHRDVRVCSRGQDHTARVGAGYSYSARRVLFEPERRPRQVYRAFSYHAHGRPVPEAPARVTATPNDILGEARLLLADSATEVRRRTVCSRAYCAAFHACLRLSSSLGFESRRNRGVHGHLIRFLTGRQEQRHRDLGLLLTRIIHAWRAGEPWIDGGFRGGAWDIHTAIRGRWAKE